MRSIHLTHSVHWPRGLFRDELARYGIRAAEVLPDLSYFETIRGKK